MRRALFAAMLALVAFAVLLHGFGLAADNLRSSSQQLTILLGRGEFLGALFAALLGALSITSEFATGRSARHCSSPRGVVALSRRRSGRAR